MSGALTGGALREGTAFTKLNHSELVHLHSVCGISTEHGRREGRRYPWAVSFLSGVVDVVVRIEIGMRQQRMHYDPLLRAGTNLAVP